MRTEAGGRHAGIGGADIVVTANGQTNGGKAEWSKMTGLPAWGAGMWGVRMVLRIEEIRPGQLCKAGLRLEGARAHPVLRPPIIPHE